MTVYDFSAKTMAGEEKPLSDFKGQVLLIVNTASECGFTPQFEGLQALYEKYHDKGFNILGFPCNQFGKQDPGTNEDIETFCQRNYGVTFPIFTKVDVKGDQAHPLFKYLTDQTSGVLNDQIKWNFTKFLINRDGLVIDRFAPQTKPSKLERDIESALK